VTGPSILPLLPPVSEGADTLLAACLRPLAAGGSRHCDHDRWAKGWHGKRIKETTVTDTPLDELGPVDYVVVEFPAGAQNFTGEMAAELVKLADAGTIRIIDVLILVKNEDGSVEATELADIEELGEMRSIEAELAELLAADDVDHLAAAMEPGSTAGVLIFENLWAAPFASAARRSGGQLIANGRIPIQAIIASIEAEPVGATTGGD
jgi:hypothetical protein